MNSTIHQRSIREMKLWRVLLAALFVALCLGACDAAGALPVPAATPTPCHGNCPPPARAAGAAHTVRTSRFSLLYFDPWSVQQKNSDGVTLAAGTRFGNITIIVNSMDVAAGTTSADLLAQVAQQTLDPNQYEGIQDNGPIRGAEIGYVDGAGESYQAQSLQANAPDVPVYIQFMASVRGSTGITFVAISPLDPNSPDTSIVPDEEYDHIVNSVQWL